MFTQVLRNSSSVHSAQRWNALFVKPIRQALYRIPMAMFCGDLRDHETGHLDSVRFIPSQVVGFEVLVIRLAHTVISDKREREYEYLSSIGRIGEGLRITDHSRVEDNFTSGWGWITERPPFKARSIVQKEVPVCSF